MNGTDACLLLLRFKEECSELAVWGGGLDDKIGPLCSEQASLTMSCSGFRPTVPRMKSLNAGSSIGRRSWASLARVELKAASAST